MTSSFAATSESVTDASKRRMPVCEVWRVWREYGMCAFLKVE